MSTWWEFQIRRRERIKLIWNKSQKLSNGVPTPSLDTPHSCFYDCILPMPLFYIPNLSQNPSLLFWNTPDTLSTLLKTWVSWMLHSTRLNRPNGYTLTPLLTAFFSKYSLSETHAIDPFQSGDPHTPNLISNLVLQPNLLCFIVLTAWVTFKYNTECSVYACYCLVSPLNCWLHNYMNSLACS